MDCMALSKWIRWLYFYGLGGSATMEYSAIAGILSIQYGNTCEMLYAGMDERFKKFMPQFEPLITEVTRFLGTGFYRNLSYQAILAVPAVLFYF